MDYMACVSNGVYPTPTPTGPERAAFGVSFGLVDFELSEAVVSEVLNKVLSIGRSGIRFLSGLLRIG